MSQRSEVPQHLRAVLLSEKQKQFIYSLLEQVGRMESDLGEPIEAMTRDRASETIDTLLAEKRQLAQQGGPRKLPANVPTVNEVPRGTYTVVFRRHDEDGNHIPGEDRITLRFREPKWGKWAGTQLCEYLFGPDNTGDYRRCANWADDGYRIWNAFKEDGRIANGIKALAGDEDARKAAGYLYSVESSNCYRCGRTLTVPASIHRGLGPECAGIVARGGR